MKVPELRTEWSILNPKAVLFWWYDIASTYLFFLFTKLSIQIRFPKLVCAFKIVCLHVYTLLWKEIIAANRTTMQVKDEEAPSMQQELQQCD